MKHFLSVITLALFAFLFYASKTQQAAVQKPAEQSFTFDYKTTSPQKPGSTHMIIDLLDPVYGGSNTVIAGTPLYKNFQQSMQADFQELLIDKGFTVGSQTYRNLNEMVFGDKEHCDLVMNININPGLSLQGSFLPHYFGPLITQNDKPLY